MKFRAICSLAFVILVSTIGARAAAPPAVPLGWNAAMRAQTLSQAEKALSGYFFVEKVPQIRAALEAHRAALVRIEDPERFADAATAVLYDASHDRHLGLWYSPDVQPKMDPHTKPSPADIARAKQFDAFVDYGYQASAHLPGNIGYIRIGGFGRYPGPKATFDRMMALVAPSDALIVDMRANGGGDPSSVNYLLAYFFPKSVEVTGFLWREHGKIHPKRMYTPRTVGGNRYIGKPVYVLTSNDTISGGEQFVYDMQALHRATIIGATTAGGANIGGPVRLSDHFAIFIPVGTARNPYTKSNWEGTGVHPDIAISPDKALQDAYTRALKAATDSFEDAAGARERALKNPEKALRRALPQV